MERQLETAKVEVTKPFAQEAELAEKQERLAALNALLNMDEKGGDADRQCEQVCMDDTSEEAEENAADAPIPYPVENARHNYAVENDNPQGLKLAEAMADKSVQRISLKEKQEAFKAQVAGTDKADNEKTKRKEETL